MVLGALADLIGGLLQLFEILGQGGPRSTRFLIAAWAAVLAMSIAFWRWHAVLFERVGGWGVGLTIAAALFGIYLIGASISSIASRFAKRPSKARRVSSHGAAADKREI